MKIILITGCNRGLSKYLLEYFAHRGWNIIACNRRQDNEFDQFIQELQVKTSIRVYTYYADFENIEALNKSVNNILLNHSKIYALINNAGFFSNTSIFNLDYKEVEACFRVNYFAPFIFTKAVAELMAHQGGGNIVNISSVLSENVTKGGSAYGASKAALNYLTKTLAQELAPFHIRINTVCCGDMEEGMFEKLNLKLQKEHLKRIAMRRPAKMKEIADSVDFLLSDKATFITGSLLRVDGGSI